MLELRRLRLLHELHRRGTVSAVAEALSYSPSTVSQQLGVLQREAGTRLFEPAGRRVRLTDAAIVLVAHAERLLADVERAEADLAAAANTVVGIVRIGAFQTASLSLVLPAMTAVRDACPQVQVELVEMESEPAFEALRSYALDLVLAEEYAGDPRPRLPGVDREDLLTEARLRASLSRDERTRGLPTLAVRVRGGEATLFGRLSPDLHDVVYGIAERAKGVRRIECRIGDKRSRGPVQAHVHTGAVPSRRRSR